jgi:hypothetical protein
MSKDELVAEMRIMMEQKDFDMYRSHYRAAYDKESRVSDNQIIEMVAGAADDMEPKEWAECMQLIENGADPFDCAQKMTLAA